MIWHDHKDLKKKNFLDDFPICCQGWVFTLSFLIGKKKKKENPCSLPSLPHKNIEGREDNAKGLVWWIRSAIESKVVVVFQLKLWAEEVCNNLLCWLDKPGAFSSS